MSDDFFKQMDESTRAVYVVEAYTGCDKVSMGIFSTKDKAQAFCDHQPEDSSCVVYPYIIDEPDFGNKRDA